MIDLLKRVVQKLDDLQIPYLVTGSVAMGFYATQRSTKDIDFIIELLPKDIQRFVEAFEKEFYCYAPAVEDSVKRKILFNVIDNETGFKIDFIPLQNNEFEQKKFEDKTLMDYYGQKVWGISAENLIISKIIWIQELISEKQLLDLENLLLIPELDRDYIRAWVSKLQLNTYQIEI